jgi:exodeoxyribonuclease VII small subunit
VLREASTGGIACVGADVLTCPASLSKSAEKIPTSPDILLPAVQYNVDRRIPLAKFEDCLQRLEKIVQELEKGEAPLEKSLTLFEEGMQLSASCRKELEEAEGKVEILLKQNGKLQAEPFEPLTERASARK